MAREKVQQFNFLSLSPVGVLEPVIKTKRRRKRNPDQKVVRDFLKQERAALYESEIKPPNINSLTENQRKMYLAIKSSGERKAEKWRETVGRDGYVAAEKIVLEEPIELGASCFECGRNLLRTRILIEKGSSESLLLQEIKCPSCGDPQTKQIRIVNHLIDWKKS